MSLLADSGLWTVGLSLGLVALALSAVTRLVRGRTPWRRADRGIVTLTPGHQLHLVEMAGRRLIVGTGPGGAPRLVCDLDARPREGLEPGAGLVPAREEGPRGR